MKKLLTLSFLCLCFVAGQAQLNLTYISDLSYGEELSDIWGYAAPDGTEYALVGTANGTSIVSLADPTNPVEVAYVPGDNSVWRDIKTWGTFAYVTTDEGNDGLTIIDMTDLPNSVTTTYITSIPGVGTLQRCHNIYIDEFGYAYLAGCNLNQGGMLIFDCDANQAFPEFTVAGPNVYSHDVYTLANRMYSSEINVGQFSIYDVTDKQNITLLGSQTTPFSFTHNSWLSKDSTVLFTTDEQANAPIGAYDITDPTDIQELDTYAPFETLGDGVIPHNVHVWEDWLIISYYSDGCILVDVSHPDNMIEVGNFDTYIPASTGFVGAWGAYPYLPSGLVLVSDIGNGLYVLEPNYVYACYLEGTATDAVTGAAINAVTITIDNTTTFEETDPLGEYKTGIATAAIYEITATRPGYETLTLNADLMNGVTTILDFEMQPLPSFALSGTVVKASNGEPIEGAQVSISEDAGFFNFDLETDANGNFTIPSFLAGEYDVAAGIWGFKTTLTSDQDLQENNPNIVIELETGYEDIFSLDLGWTVESDNYNFFGDWERGISITQVVGPGISITPDEDLDEDPGNKCYVTGNGADFNSSFLLNGFTLLTSPTFDLLSYNEPMLSFYTWYMNLDVSGGGYPPAGSSDLMVYLTNGDTTVLFDEIQYDGDLFGLDWVFSGEVDIASLIEPTANMQFIVEAVSANYDEVTEAGLDFFRVWDANPVSVNDVEAAAIQINAFPNPSNTAFNFSYELADLDVNAQISINNVIGQTIETISINNLSDNIRFGAEWSPGIYFVNITNGTDQSKTIKLVKQ